MKYITVCIVFLAICSCSMGFVPARFVRQTALHMRMTDETPKPKETPKPPKEVTLVPVDEDNIKAAGAITGGVLGFVLGGPWGAVILAAISNYVVKKDDETGEAIRGFGKTSLESFNFLTKLNAKYEISNKVGGAIGDAISSTNTDSESLDSIKTTLKDATAKIEELDKEYDFFGKGKQVVVAAGTVSDSAIEKVSELNAKYDFLGQAKKVVTDAVNKDNVA